MKSRLTRLGAAATLVVATGWTAACGAADPSAAAIVDGQVIKESDVMTVVRELSRIPSNANLPAKDVVSRLILAEVVKDHAGELNAPAVSTDAIRSQLEAPDQEGKTLGPWSDATVQVLRDVSVLNAVMQSQSQAKAIELMQKADVTVNPKYGSFDRQRLDLSDTAPNWLQGQAPGTIEPSAPPTGEPAPTGNPSTLPTGSPTTEVPGSPAPSAATPTS